MSKIDRFMDFGCIQFEASNVISVVRLFFEYESYRYGIFGISKKTTPLSWEYRISDTKGADIFKISHKRPDNSVEGLLNGSLSLETNTFKASIEYYKQVTLSEYALGVVGALSETQYTPDGKQTSERLDSGTFITTPLETIKRGDDRIVIDKLVKAVKEVTPHIPARVPLREEIVIGEPYRPKEFSRFERFVRSYTR